ncbi:LamG domain-containing protein [Runella sp.]|uniref:LamG domain-containing protein n=1 Tax=Runella sp. TaxID=1960881 RepID=UPI00301985A0
MTTTNLTKGYILVIAILGLISCDYNLPDAKTLETCQLPTGVTATKDASDPKKYTFTLNGSTTDLTEVIWRPNTPLTQVTGNFSTVVTANDGSYTMSADITTKCGEKLTLSVAFTVSSAIPTNLMSGLVAYFLFNSNINDESGTIRNGTNNGATLTTDRFGIANKAYYFNGSSKITLPDNNLPFGNKDRTISMWVYASIRQSNIHNGNPGHLLKYGVEGVEYQNCNIALWGDVLRVANWSSPPDIDFSYAHPVNKWFHLVVKIENSNQVKIFIDGVLQYTSSVETWNTLTNGFLTIGEYFSQGKLDDIRIYNRALTDTEVSQLYNSEKP